MKDQVVSVTEKKVVVTVQLQLQSEQNSVDVQDFEAVFWYHGGASTGWISSKNSGKVEFKMYTTHCTCYFGVRKDKIEEQRETPVKFAMTAYQTSSIKDNFTIQFVLKD